MPPSLEDGLIVLLDEFESLCAEAEIALRGRDWEALTGFLHDQRRLRQQIVNGLDAAGLTPGTAPAEVQRRLQVIFAFRNDQLRRLTAYRDDVSTKLQNARKWKDIARSARAGIGPTPVLISQTQ